MFSVSSSAHLARHEGRLQRQLGRGQQERFASQLFRNAIDFVEHLAGLDFSDIVLGVALAIAHADFGRLLRDRLVREDANPDAAATLHVTRDCTACRLDLARRQTAALGRLQSEVAERHLGATRRDAGIAALLFLAEFSACWLQHVYSPLASPLGGVPAGATALRTRLTAGVFGASPPASADLSAPSTAGATAWRGAPRSGAPRPGAPRSKPPPPGRPRLSGPPGRAPRRGRRSSSCGIGVALGASP